MPGPWHCDDCGQEHPRGCHAHVRRCRECGNAVGRRRNGEDLTACRKCVKLGKPGTDIDERAPCTKPAKTAMTVCHTHGGMAPQTVDAAQRRQQFQAARDAADTFGKPREVDPTAALEEELWRTAGVIDFYMLIVQAEERDELKQYTHDEQGRRWEKPSVWVELLNQERRHFVAVAKIAKAAGLEERKVTLAEAQGAMIVALMRAVLTDLDRDDPEAHAIVARHLRAIDGGAAA